MNGKIYWTGLNVKFDSKFTLSREPVILDLARVNDDRVCLQYDRVVCFTKNKDGEDPEGRMREITQELKRVRTEEKAN